MLYHHTLDCSKSVSVFSISSDKCSDKCPWVSYTFRKVINVFSYLEKSIKHNYYLVDCNSLGSVSCVGRRKSMSGSQQHPACSQWSLWLFQHWSDHVWSGQDETTYGEIIWLTKSSLLLLHFIFDVLHMFSKIILCSVRTAEVYGQWHRWSTDQHRAVKSICLRDSTYTITGFFGEYLHMHMAEYTGLVIEMRRDGA